MGVMIFNVVYALGELAVMYPVSGGMSGTLMVPLLAELLLRNC